MWVLNCIYFMHVTSELMSAKYWESNINEL